MASCSKVFSLGESHILPNWTNFIGQTKLTKCNFKIPLQTSRIHTFTAAKLNLYEIVVGRGPFYMEKRRQKELKNTVESRQPTTTKVEQNLQPSAAGDVPEMVLKSNCWVSQEDSQAVRKDSNVPSREMKGWIDNWGVFFGMLFVQLIAAGLQILTKIILNEGTFVFAYLTYRHIVGGLCVLPFALHYEGPLGGGNKLSWPALLWLFIVALTGISMGMGFFYYGLADTTATYATNSMNLVPVVTFFFSIIFRMERLELKTRVGIIKSLSVLACIGGALTIALYKGRSFHIAHSGLALSTCKQHWARGTIFLVCSCLADGLWFISQAKLLQVYPYKFWATFYMCVFATVQQVIIGLCINRSKAAWQLGWDLRLLTIGYTGLLATAVTFWLTSWAVSKRGPMYPSMFNSLALILVAVAEALFLGQDITVGSLMGMTLSIIGLFGFLCAKNKEVTWGATLPVTATNKEGTVTAESVNSAQSASNVALKNLS